MSDLPLTKVELLEQLRDAWTELQQALAGMQEEQVTLLHDPAGWTVQDHLNHLATWEEGIATLLERNPEHNRYAAMGVDAATAEQLNEEELLNGIIRERTPARTIMETRAALRAAHDHLLSALDALDDAELQKEYSYYDPSSPGQDSGQPIVAWITGNSSGHYREHLPWIMAIPARSASGGG